MAGQVSRENGKKGGRAPGFKRSEAESFGEYLRKRIKDEWEPIVTMQIAQAKQGDDKARKDLFDRAYGKPQEFVEHSGHVEVSFDE